jgi:hypothetical protein
MNFKTFFFPNKKKASISLQQAKEVGNKLFVDWKRVSPKTLAQGMSIELEHKDTLISLGVKDADMLKAVARIALDHLSETPHYYSKLKKVEGK